ncbi:PREDICTED: protein fem-1 homolog C-like [Priapulus caudatus]|uniref:Protein fem-1 homolog C-like n=1 Tax=Priapulus caudatus TaxID=37621 RepID=A0ABM1E6M2_PRICU|nr:PREDICTED: protein fem-1 homolog C-like [Priapulus caudatus]
MEFKNVVYIAARDGKLRRLRIFLDHRSREAVKVLVSSLTSDATPLLAAARNGHHDIVEYLVKECDASVTQVGSVTFDGETIEGAPPLWCAAAAGHLNIVKLLHQNGASVNGTTYTNSTPLRAACFDGHMDIVKYLVENNADIEVANRHGHTCLMISCYKGHYDIAKFLIQLGAEINRKSLKGNTAMHDCAESGSLDIMQLLLTHGAKMTVDSYGMSPLLAAAVTGHTPIVEYLVKRAEVSRQERIDALELLGATFVDKKRDMMGALKYWRRAMEERYADAACLVRKPVTVSQIAAYENTQEVTTMEQLDELIADPDEMRMQALLLRERILGPAHPDTSYYIRYRGAVYADMGNFERCVSLWMYALDMQQEMLDPLCPMTQSSFLSFAELFAFMLNETRFSRGQCVNFDDVMVIFRKAVHEVERGAAHLKTLTVLEKDATHFGRTLVITIHLVCILCRVQSQTTRPQEHALKQAVYNFLRLKVTGPRDWTPLHYACSKQTSTVGRYPVCGFPSLDVVTLLLEVGAATDAPDAEGNTPLHVAAVNTTNGNVEIMKALLNGGAHLDVCNNEHKTAMELLQGAATCVAICPMRHTSLQCLAARMIMHSDIPYKGHLPKRTEAFVEMH